MCVCMCVYTHIRTIHTHTHTNATQDIATWLRANAKVSLDNGESISDFLDEEDGALLHSYTKRICSLFDMF